MDAGYELDKKRRITKDMEDLAMLYFPKPLINEDTSTLNFSTIHLKILIHVT